MLSTSNRILILTFTCLTIKAYGQTQLQLSDLLEQVEPAIVRIETKDGLGSGFVASHEGVVVTNLHVIAGSAEAKILFANGSSYAVTGILASDEARDIAVISTECNDVDPLPIAESLPRKGESVVTFGSPAGLSFSASEGIVSAIRTPEEAKSLLDLEGGTWLQTTAPISPGNSGGPLMNRNGEVIGINTFYVNRGQNLNFAISSVDILELLKAASSSQPSPLSEQPKLPSRSESEIDRSLLSKAVASFIREASPLAERFIESTDSEISLMEDTLKMIRSGRVNNRINYPRAGYKTGRVRNRLQYFFHDEDAKTKLISEKEEELEKLKKISSMVSADDGMIRYAWAAGPILSLNAPGSIGRVEKIEVSQVTGPTDFHGYIGRTRVSVRGIPTALLVTDQILEDGIFLFSGVETYTTRIDTENRIVEITYVPEDVFFAVGRESLPQERSQAALKSSDDTSSKSPRQWSDATGKFQVMATLVHADKDSVTLKKDSGDRITVPIARLSEKDQEWVLANQEPDR